MIKLSREQSKQKKNKQKHRLAKVMEQKLKENTFLKLLRKPVSNTFKFKRANTQRVRFMLGTHLF